MPTKKTAVSAKETVYEPEATIVSSNLPITLDVRINSLIPSGPVRARASVSINGQFAVKGIKVMDGQNGLFVSMPSYKNKDGVYKEYCFPVSGDFREQLHTAVFDAYAQAMEQAYQPQSHRAPVGEEIGYAEPEL